MTAAETWAQFKLSNNRSQQFVMSERRTSSRRCRGTPWLLLVFLISSSVHGQQRSAHRLYHGDMPPGAIGYQQAPSQGAWRGYFQPVEIRVPGNALVTPASLEGSLPDSSSRLKVGLMVGQP